jgi:hypothetical protein
LLGFQDLQVFLGLFVRVVGFEGFFKGFDLGFLGFVYLF